MAAPSVPAGTRVGPYEIVALIGAGGMGEVYRARDVKLNRDVAVKLLPPSFASDPDRIARFQREAQALAAVSHPHIAQVHGIEESGGAPAIVMELVEGEDLSARIGRGPIPRDEAIAMTLQIADALAAAHQQGVVHRDLKPANIKVTVDGAVKILDFGLAKALDSAPLEVGSVSNSPTLSLHATAAGVLLGTAAYMSPEQARGKSVDKQADIWAFGCVLYEMLTGARAFGGAEIADTLALVLTKEPDWSRLPPESPPALLRLLRRCLAKERRQRVADIADARLDLEEAAASGARTAGVVPRDRPAVAGAILAGTVIAAAMTGGALTFFVTTGQSGQAAPAVVRFDAPPPPGSWLVVDLESDDIAVSPDGSRVVFEVGLPNQPTRLYLRHMERGDAVRLDGTDGARNPFFSHDGKWIGFLFNNGDLRRIPVDGGPATGICARCAGGPRGVSWGENDVIVFSGAQGAAGLSRVSAMGGEPRIVSAPEQLAGENAHLWPDLLPGGRHVLFEISTNSGSRIAVRDLITGAQQVLVNEGSHPRFVASGHIVYATPRGLRAVPFDHRALKVTGSSVAVPEQVLVKAPSATSFAVGQNGTLAYVSGELPSELRTLIWLDRAGNETAITAPPRTYRYPRLSPDGHRLAVDVSDQQRDIWIWDFAQLNLTRFTFGAGVEQYPVWSPDGRRIAFGTGGLLAWAASDGSGSVESLTKTGSSGQVPYGFTPDGKTLIVRGSGVSAVSIHDGKSVRIADGMNGEPSPDGRWLAYQSQESGDNEIVVRPFPAVDQGRWQVSTSGGTHPRWARNGRELFYLSPDNNLMRVAVQAGESFVYGAPEVLLRNVPVPSLSTGRPYDVAPDGQRFLFIKTASVMPSGADLLRLQVVLNWAATLTARASPP